MYILGIDVGTSSMEGILFDEKGTFITQANAAYPLIHCGKGRIEQDPNQWVQALKKIMDDIHSRVPALSTQLGSVTVSGQMHSLVCLDHQGSLVRHAILWNDTRTHEACEYINEKMGERLFEITGNVALEGFTLPKVIWLQQNEPESYSKTCKMMMPKDYVNFVLTGIPATDFSDASGTLLFDPHRKTWSKEILDLFDIDSSMCPPLQQAGSLIGIVSSHIATWLNIPMDTKIIMGGADNASSALGCGMVHCGDTMVSIGTSGTVLSITDSIQTKALHHFEHVLPNMHYSMGVTLSAGKSLEWIKGIINPEITYDVMLDNLKLANHIDENLFFTPYLAGERTPYADSTIRGSFVGLDLEHTRNSLIVAVMEGITFSLNDCLNCIKRETTNIQHVFATGGATKNKEWLQLQANIFGKHVVTHEAINTCALGAVLLGIQYHCGAEVMRSLLDLRMKNPTTYVPNQTLTQRYADKYKKYSEIYSATKNISTL